MIMPYSKPHYRKTLTNVSIALLTLTAASRAIAIAPPLTNLPLLAQAPSPTSFPVPSSIPEGSMLRVDGSTSMRVVNSALKERFEQQFSEITVALDASSTDEALAALQQGEIELAAIGRPLTDAEKAQGLIEVPINREKIAIIVGANNPFNSNLTFEQFAQMFRGEITDWSEVGGQPGAIRFVDRPDYSDTRLALSQYEVFEGIPFETGPNAVQAADDETPTVIRELGNDGISYAVASQVLGQEDVVTILPMHETLPDDPRYPYSQPRGYVYREGALSPAAQAFLGFATSEPGQEIVGEAIETEAAGVVAPGGTAVEDIEKTGESDPKATGTTLETAEGSPDAVTGAAAGVVSPSPDAETALVPATGADGAAAAGRGGFPWWLLGIPILGGLLWWLFKGREAVPPAAPAAATPVATPPVVTPPAASGATVPLGAAAVAGAAVTGAAVAGAALLPTRETSRIILTPRNCRDAYAYWEIPDAVARDLPDNRSLKLRLYDVTDIELDRQSAHSMKEFDCIPGESDLHLPIAIDDRDYRVELGYTTADGQWVKVAQSDQVRVPACPPVVNSDGIKAAAALGGVALAGAAVAKTAMPLEPVAAVDSAASAPPAFVPPAGAIGESRMVITPYDPTNLYAYWETPESHRASLREQGGRELQLRLYDVTDYDATDYDVPEVDPNAHSAHRVQVFELDDQATDRHIPITDPDRVYRAEIGYGDNDGKWLMLARSHAVNMAEVPARAAVVPAAIVGSTAILATGATAVSASESTSTLPTIASVEPGGAEPKCTIAHVRVHSKHNSFLLDQEQMRRLQDQIAVSTDLVQGSYIVRIKEGVFSYQNGRADEAEPLVLLWIYGGKVINQKTNVPVAATWSTLNGYNETLNLDVVEPCQLCAFFIDTHLTDNDGGVTLSVIKL
jgi:phosphate transport system substrate-binding protein